MSFTAQILWTVFRLSNCFDQLQTRLLQSMTPRGPRGGVKFSNSPFSNIIRPNRIKLPSSRSKRRKYEFKKKEKISTTRGAARADLFYWDCLHLSPKDPQRFGDQPLVTFNFTLFDRVKTILNEKIKIVPRPWLRLLLLIYIF